MPFSHCHKGYLHFVDKNTLPPRRVADVSELFCDVQSGTSGCCLAFCCLWKAPCVLCVINTQDVSSGCSGRQAVAVLFTS